MFLFFISWVLFYFFFNFCFLFFRFSFFRFLLNINKKKEKKKKGKEKEKFPFFTFYKFLHFTNSKNGWEIKMFFFLVSLKEFFSVIPYNIIDLHSRFETVEPFAKSLKRNILTQ